MDTQYERDSAWLAGLFEAKGNFTWTPPSKMTGKQYPVVTLRLTDRWMLEKAARLIGPELNIKPSPGSSSTYELRYTGKGVMPVLLRILPYIGDLKRHIIAGQIGMYEPEIGKQAKDPAWRYGAPATFHGFPDQMPPAPPKPDKPAPKPKPQPRPPKAPTGKEKQPVYEKTGFLSNEQVIQLAGLLSGRGSIYQSTPDKQGRQYPVISFSTSDADLSIELADMLRANATSKTKGEFKSTVREFRVSGAVAEELLERMFPYLMGSKGGKAAVILGYV